MRVENYSPLQKIDKVLLSPPGTEAVMGLMIPAYLSLFEPEKEGDTSVPEASLEHDSMVKELEKNGIQVFNMRTIIGEVLSKKNQSCIETPHQLFSELMRRISWLNAKYNMGNLEKAEQELKDLIQIDIERMGVDAAVAINGALTNCINHEGKYLPFNIDQSPAANFMFWRDTNHITGSSLGTHKMFFPIRQQEVLLAQLGLEALGIRYEQTLSAFDKGSIEGGDILPMEFNENRYALIGKAERTSWEGVEAWFQQHEEEFSQSGEGLIPTVVEGPMIDTQDQMHLDTYAQQISNTALIHCREISDQRNISTLQRKGGEIIKVDSTVFTNWINKNATNIYEMSKKEQLEYAPNVLVDGGRSTVYMSREDSPDITKFIEEQVVTTVMLGFKHLTNFYGGAHCLTSEIRKS